MRLAADALAERLRALARIRAYWRDARTALAATGGIRPAMVGRCSLLRPAGSRRAFAVVRADLDAVRDAAHRNGCTVNDALLAAVTGALRELLGRRGEHVETLSVSVPVSARSTTTSGELGNRLGVLIAALPVEGDAGRRMRATPPCSPSARRRRRRRPPPARSARCSGCWPSSASAAGTCAASAASTLVSNVRGPDRQLTFAGAAVTGIIAVAVAESGNVSVSFEILSCSGTVVITLIADPDAVPDLDGLAALLWEELADVTATGA
ncbi:WS/DGAT domain-containing protein [Nonomuraea sp. NPDC048826]|uniref:WS/DGAT domain-containing protein n=1 Tax=Nonomuraea sp. NPDC048826 TaxID=3364347 RepID=UPI003713903C